MDPVRTDFEVAAGESGQAGSSLATHLSVCHVTSGALWAGIEAQVAALLRTMSTYSRIDLLVILFNEGRLAEELRRCGIEVHIVPERAGVWAIAREAAKVLRSRNIELIHSHRPKEHLTAYLVARFCNIPALVRTQHGHPETGKGWRGIRYSAALGIERLIARFGPAHTISVSSELADYLAPSFGRQKITVIPNGIDLRQTTSARSRAEAKAWLGIDPCVPVICSVARLSRVKRHDLFLQTALHILRDHPHAQFLVAGSGPLQAQISNMVHTFGLNDNVRMMGDRPDIYDVLAACDILLITSDNEGMPMVVLEAMALGTVVVSRGIGGIPEVIGRSSGVLVNSSDPAVLAEACSKVLGDSAWHKRLVQSARETVTQTYTAEVMASQTIQLYERLLGEQRHSG